MTLKGSEPAMTSSIEVSELKPCPFCGDSANVQHWDSEVSILCSNCNVRSAPFFAENEAKCIEAWNTRAKDNSLSQDEVDGLSIEELLYNWQSDQSEWFNADIREIVGEFARWYRALVRSPETPISDDEVERIIQRVSKYDVPENDPRRRYTCAQMLTAIRAALVRSPDTPITDDVRDLSEALKFARARFKAITEYGDPFEIMEDPEEFGGTDDGPETVCMVYENIQGIARQEVARIDAALSSIGRVSVEGDALAELVEVLKTHRVGILHGLGRRQSEELHAALHKANVAILSRSTLEQTVEGDGE